LQAAPKQSICAAQEIGKCEVQTQNRLESTRAIYLTLNRQTPVKSNSGTGNDVSQIASHLRGNNS
jgi:hypothetical protein